MSGTYTTEEKVEYALKTALFRTMQSKDQPSSLEKSAPPRIFPKNIMKKNLIEKGEGDIDEDGYYVGRTDSNSAYYQNNDLVNLEEAELTISNYRIIDPVSNKITDKRVSDMTTVNISQTSHSAINALDTNTTNYPLKSWFFRGHYGSHSGTAAFDAASLSYDGLQLAWDKSTVGDTAGESDIVPHLKFYLQVQTNFTNVAHGDNITYGHDLMKGLIGLDQNFSTTIQVVQGQGGNCVTLGSTGASTGDFWFTQATSGTLSFYGVTNKVNASASLSNLATTKFPMISYIRYTGETGFGAGSGGGGSVSLASADSNVSNMIGGTPQTMTTTTFNFDGKLEINGGYNSSHIRISEGSHLGQASEFRYPALSYYARYDHTSRTTDPLVSGTGNSGGGASSSIVFVDKPGNASYANNVRSSDITFYTANNNVGGTLGHEPLERMRITNTGKIGINMANPYFRLHISGSGQNWDTSPGIGFDDFHNNKHWFVGTANNINPGDFYIRTCPSNSTYPTASNLGLTIKYDGNVGIGTTSPDEKLQVNGCIKIKQQGQIQHDSTNAYNGLVFENHNSLDSWYMGYRYGASFTIGNYGTGDSSYTERLHINAGNGNVGIGTTEPSEKLDIVGKIKGKIYKDTGVGPGDGSMGYNSGGKTNHKDGSYTYTRGGGDSVHDINGLGIPFPDWKNDTTYRITIEIKSSVAGSVRYSGGSGMWTTYKTIDVSTEYQTYIFYVNGSTFKPTGFKNYHADMTVRQFKIEELVDDVLQLENPVINETLRVEPEPTGAAIVEIPDQLNSNSAINASHRYGGHFHYINTEKHKGLYVIGGYDGNTQHTIHRFDVEEGMFTNSWENVQFSPSGTTFGSYYGASIVYNGDVIIHGGEGHGSYKSGVYKLDFHVDYPTSTEIHDGTGTAPPGRNAHSAFLHQNRYMYIYGGRGGSHTYYSDMWRFDLTNNTWSEVSQNNTGEGPGVIDTYSATIWKDRYIVLLGGRTNSSGGYLDTENIYLYDLLNNSWQKERLTFFDDTVYNLFATTSSLLWSRWPQIVGNCLIIYGGYINSGAGMGCIWSINLLDFRLRILKKSAAHMRYHIPVTKVGNDIYAFGGYSNGNYQTVLKIRLSNAASIVNTINPGYGLTRNRVEQNGRDRMFISDTFRTYSWRQAYLFAQSKGGKLPTMSYIRNNYEFLYRGSVDKWTAVFDDVNHRPDWVQIGSSNHPYGKSHTMEGSGYPSWGDGDNTSHAFRDTIIVVFQDDIMLNNTLIVKADGNIGIGQADTLNGSLYRLSFGSTQRYYSENAGAGYSTAICFHENNNGGGNYFYGIGLSRPTSGQEGVGIHGGTEGEIMRNDNASIFCRRGNDNRVGISTHGSTLDTTWASCIIGNGVNTCCYVRGYYTTSNTGPVGYLHSTGASSQSSGSVSIGLYVNYAIYAIGNIYSASDRRIKKNIVDVPDNKALENIRNIPCRYYDYIDKNRGQDKTIGFIAQEVREVFPMAVTIVSDFLPNIQKSIEFVFEKISEEEFKMTTNDLPLIDVKFRFICSNNVDEGEEPIVREYDLKRNEDGSFTFSREYDNIFCYGYEVDDFHIVDKQKLFALNFSATQELDRKVIALEEENQELDRKVIALEEENQELKTKVATLESELAIIKQHLGI